MSDKTPEFFTDEFGNSYFLAYRNEAGSAYRVVPREGTSPLANAPRSDEERRELVRQFGSIENFGVALLDIVERLNRAVPYGLEDFAVLVDAAAEIERLRAERDEWQAGYHKAWSELGLAADEIERLRALCNDLHHDATCAESFCRLCGEGIREWEARRG